jgi:PPK2 family polyphosphate:nucleotide phosphotransferase
MLEAIPNPYRVPYDGSFRQDIARTAPPKDAPKGKKSEKILRKLVGDLDELQRILYAQNKHSLLLVFQAMDTAGKDSTIRAVMSGVNPAGCQVFSFKQPSAEELDHDFLWRTARCLPERGRIGVFNRSYYEEVLVVRVHPEFLKGQKLPDPVNLKNIWAERYESIRNHEMHLAENGTLVLKFWLNVSKEEQAKRLLSRIEKQHKNWKFSANDLRERDLWQEYMHAYQQALNATSRPWAPWYAIPADDKKYMQACVAGIVVENLRKLKLSYPGLTATQKNELKKMARLLKKNS